MTEYKVGQTITVTTKDGKNSLTGKIEFVYFDGTKFDLALNENVTLYIQPEKWDVEVVNVRPPSPLYGRDFDSAAVRFPDYVLVFGFMNYNVSRSTDPEQWAFATDNNELFTWDQVLDQVDAESWGDMLVMYDKAQ